MRMNRLLRKRWLIVIGITLPLLVAAACLDPSYTAEGFFKGDSFYLRRSTTYWRKVLDDPTPSIQLQTHKQLREGGAAAVPVLVELLKERKNSGWEDAKVRWLAAEILGQIRP